MISDISPQQSDFEVVGDLPDEAIDLLATLLLGMADEKEAEIADATDHNGKT